MLERGEGESLFLSPDPRIGSLTPPLDKLTLGNGLGREERTCFPFKTSQKHMVQIGQN